MIGGHVWRGISRSDVKELGDVIDSGEAALLVVGATTLEEALDKAGLKPEKKIGKKVDVSTADVDAAVAKIRALGGEATDTQEVSSGWIADCKDDQGVPFSIGRLRPEYQ